MFEQLRIVELHRGHAGAVCGRLWAGWGAEVHCVSGPAADTRLDVYEQAWLQTGKRVASLSDLRGLIAEADVVIDHWTPAQKQTLDLVPARDRPARAIWCCITPFGLDGPDAAVPAEEITLYAQAGLMHCTGDGARAPLNAQPPVVSVSAGLYAYAAIAMALLARERSGAGLLIDLAEQEAAAQNIEVMLAEYRATGRVARRNGDRHNMVPWRTYPCADGEAAIIGGPIRHWLKAAPWFGADDLLQPPLDHMAGRIAERERTEALMRPWLQTQTREALFHRGQSVGLAWAPLRQPHEVLDEAQNQARGFFTRVPGADGAGYTVPGAPYRLGERVWDAPPANRIPRTAQPLVSGAAPQPPLAGLRVLDLSHDWAGPHVTRVLADYGAEVIKIEYPRRLDGMRGAYPDRINGHPRCWQLHRNKASITLDLRQPDDHALFLDLAAEADLVVENGRPGVMAALGLDHARLRARNPRLSLISMSAFGADGPCGGYAGYGGTLEAASGVQALTAYAAGETPFRVRELDVINGLFGLTAALGALLQRVGSGQGSAVELSEYETSQWCIGGLLARAAAAPASVAPLGNRHRAHAPQGCYACAGEDRWITLCVRDDAEWAALAEWLGPDAAIPDWRTVAGRRRDHDRIDALLADRCASLSAETVEAAWRARDLCCGQVRTVADLCESRQLLARRWFRPSAAGALPGLPFRFVGLPEIETRKGPDLGADNPRYFARHPRGLAGIPDLSPERLGTAYTLR